MIGEFEYSLDVKGRLVMPSKIREDMGEKFIITRDFVRFFLSGAIECEIDKQGRFLVASNLREYAGLEKEAVITGVGTRIEIWDKDKWKDYNSEENLSADQIAENMANLGMLGI